tara:strand:+ start:2896 stop:3663 length:768 start_codon:yes stop_codon:yes gene_type:complete
MISSSHILKNRLIKAGIINRLKYSLFISAFVSFGNLHAQQNDTWKPNMEAQPEVSVIFPDKKWEIAVGYGSLLFMEASKSTKKEEPFFLPNGLITWQLDVTWHFQNKLAANFNFGIQQEKNIPPTPNLFAILGGGELEIEGSGGGFFPVKGSILYYPFKNRLQLFYGAGLGMVMGKSQYTEVRGNIFDGITKTDFIYQDKVPFLGITAGCGYQTGNLFRFVLKTDYAVSTKFKETVGGFTRYHGFTVLAQASIIF